AALRMVTKIACGHILDHALTQWHWSSWGVPSSLMFSTPQIRRGLSIPLPAFYCSHAAPGYSSAQRISLQRLSALVVRTDATLTSGYRVTFPVAKRLGRRSKLTPKEKLITLTSCTPLAPAKSGWDSGLAKASNSCQT